MLTSPISTPTEQAMPVTIWATGNTTKQQALLLRTKQATITTVSSLGEPLGLPARLVVQSILMVRAFTIVVLAIPLAVVFINLDIFDSVFSLALMHTALALPTTILVIGSVFASIPYELEEAAQVFGCTPFKAFRHVVFPLVMPGIAAAAVFTFVMSWNEVFAASILTVHNRTLPAQVLNTLNQSSQAYQFAGAFFMMIPALIFIFVIRRYLFNMWGQVSK